MLRPELILVAALALSSGSAVAQSAPKGDALRGRKIFAAYGCYQCHGYQGQGSNAGSKVAPNPLPYAAFVYQLRQPRARMPAYTPKTVANQDVADIYAYMLTIPEAKAVAEIPLLAGQGSKPQ